MGKVILNQKINGSDLIAWFHYGAEEVSLHKKHLNDINVFPVADGDTGTNLVSTLRAMVDIPKRNDTFCGMINGISEAGMANARGNSGIIFASYINGLAMESATYEEIGKEEFSHVAYKAVDYLYEAIETPVKGTMITVISDWAEFLFSNHEKYLGFEDFFAEAYKRAKESLEKTTSQMEILRKNNIVDSGAEGFVKFLKGINHFLVKGKEETRAEAISDIPFHFPGEVNTEKQFCAEFFLNLNGTESNFSRVVAEIKNVLKTKGESIIIFNHGDKLKVHVHTNQPEIVVQSLLNYGTIICLFLECLYLRNP